MKLRKIDGENLAEDLDREAELKIALANIEGESTTKQIELNNKINAIKQEQRTKDNNDKKNKNYCVNKKKVKQFIYEKIQTQKGKNPE